jgi:hypothetical protein
MLVLMRCHHALLCAEQKKAKKKMPEKPKLIPDTEFRWYVLQVYTGSELQCQSIINSKLIAWKIADRISQILVPVTKAPHTIGRRVRVKDIPVYLVSAL